MRKQRNAIKRFIGNYWGKIFHVAINCIYILLTLPPYSIRVKLAISEAGFELPEYVQHYVATRKKIKSRGGEFYLRYNMLI